MISRTLLAGAAAVLLMASPALAGYDSYQGNYESDARTADQDNDSIWEGSWDWAEPDWNCGSNSCSDGDDIGTDGQGSDMGGSGDNSNNW